MANILMFDGPDGVGKSTLVNAVHQQFEDCVVPAVKLGFPSEQLRAQAKSGKVLLSAREFLLDIAGGLSSAMSMHRRIICDRSFLATMAYQGCTIATVKEYMPPALFNDKLNSVVLFRLYLPPEDLEKRINTRDDVAVGLDSATGISERKASVDTLSRLDERFRMATEMLADSEPWKSSYRFRIIPVDMSASPERCFELVMRLIDNVVF